MRAGIIPRGLNALHSFISIIKCKDFTLDDHCIEIQLEITDRWVSVCVLFATDLCVVDTTWLCFRKGTSSCTTIWVSEWVKKTQLRVMVFCNTVTLALTNKHDTVVGSSSRANRSTLTDGCWDGIKHPAPNPRSRFLACFCSEATPFLPGLSHPLLFYTNFFICFLLHAAVNIYPILILSALFYHPTTQSDSPFFLFSLIPRSCPFAHYFTPSANTASSSSGDGLTRKSKKWQERECASPHCI